MAFNNWPYTNFQDLNLGWILAKVKAAVTSSAAAVATAEAVEAEVGTYSQRISDAEAEADSARNIANTARGEALNAQSDATSGIAIGQAAQGTANTALNTANNALNIANGAADSADTAADEAATAARDAATALQLANLASEDYLNVGITVFPAGGGYSEDTAESRTTVRDILNANLANKKIRFTLEDARTGDSFITYDYIIDPVYGTVSDIDVYVAFDTSVSSSTLKFYLVQFSDRVVSNEHNYTIHGSDITFSGGGGGISIQDVIDTVNDGDTNALLSTAQTLSAAQKAQVKQNLGISDSGGSYSPYLIPVNMSGGVYSTTATGEDVFDHILDCRINFNGLYYYPIGSSLSGPFGHAYFACADPSVSGKIENDIFDLTLNGTNACTVTRYDKDIALLPTVTSADNDKFLRVVSGAWAAATVPNAESNSFGGV